MDTSPFIIERTYNAPVQQVWEAITNKDKMKEWYFDLEEFKPEVGFKFEFWGEDKGLRFLHKCEVTEVIPGKKISYTWRYEEQGGDSEVIWELFPEGNKTTVRLTHTGLHTFPQDLSSFRKESFARGWTDFVGTALRDYVER